MDDPTVSRYAQEVGVFDAKTRLSELLEQVAGGAEIVITKHGTPVARLVPPGEERPDPKQVEAIFKRLRKAAKGFTLTSDEIRAARDEGRL